jgi:predicted RNase H-like HicB family nuclease
MTEPPCDGGRTYPATYELIDDEEPYYGEVPDLPGVWATGKTLEACRKNRAGVIDGWIVFLLMRDLPIPVPGEIVPLDSLE